MRFYCVALAMLTVVWSAGCLFRAKSDSAKEGEEKPQRPAHEVACQPDETPPDGAPIPRGTGARTPPELVATSKTVIAEMKQVLERVVAARKVARTRNDVVRLNCVNDRLLEIRKLVNLAERAHTYLVDAITDENDDERDRQYQLITETHQQIWVLGDEATACACDQ